MPLLDRLYSGPAISLDTKEDEELYEHIDGPFREVFSGIHMTVLSNGEGDYERRWMVMGRDRARIEVAR